VREGASEASAILYGYPGSRPPPMVGTVVHLDLRTGRSRWRSGRKKRATGAWPINPRVGPEGRDGSAILSSKTERVARRRVG